MEQHPVPQNVTTFQFRLIGDMTIKQFGYLLGGCILAYLSYILPVPIIFSYPLAAMFALGGFGFAFVPIEERPMDIWVMSFLKNVYSPTQFIWQKNQPTTKTVAPAAVPAQTPAMPTHTEKRVATVSDIHDHASHHDEPTRSPLSSISLPKTEAPAHPHEEPASPPHPVLGRLFSTSPAVPEKEKTSPPRATITHAAPKRSLLESIQEMIQNIFPKKVVHAPLGYQPGALLSATPLVSVTGTRIPTEHIPQKPTPPPAPTHDTAPPPKEEPKQKVKEINALQERINALQGEKTNKEASDARILELQKQLTDSLSEKERMEKELKMVRQQMTFQNRAFQPLRTATPSPLNTPAPQPTVHIVSPDAAEKAGIPRLTSFPNVITGIVKDSEGNLLPGVLVTVKDKEEIPLRALKTNKLGQFAASTPLTNGTYVVEIEDPRKRFAFDRAQIQLTGAVLPALEIVAISQKQIDRDKLAKEIFGNQVK